MRGAHGEPGRVARLQREEDRLVASCYVYVMCRLTQFQLTKACNRGHPRHSTGYTAQALDPIHIMFCAYYRYVRLWFVYVCCMFETQHASYVYVSAARLQRKEHAGGSPGRLSYIISYHSCIV